MLGREDADTLSLQQCEEALQEIDQIEIPFMQTFNLWNRVSIAHNLIHSPILGRLAADLLGVDAVRVYQDSVFIKRPGDGPTLWHSDLNMCPFDTNDFLTIWIPLQDVPAESEGGSGLTFATASHRDFALPYCKQSYTITESTLHTLYTDSILYTLYVYMYRERYGEYGHVRPVPYALVRGVPDGRCQRAPRMDLTQVRL